MKNLRIVMYFCLAGLCLAVEIVQAADEDFFLGKIMSPLEQTIGQGRSSLWTLPQVATQYQPLQPTPAMQAALQAQHEGRFLEALIMLEDAVKSRQANEDNSEENKVEISLLHSSFLLQGNQPKQAIAELVPLLANKQHSANAYALTAMGYLQLGKMQEALEAANRAQGKPDGILPSLSLSYALQGMSRLAEAREVMHGINTQAKSKTPQLAITFAREAELALTLDQIQSAKTLVNQAREVDAKHPYVIAVSGLVYLIEGKASEAKAAFETALQRDPKDPKALLGLGLAEIKLGNFQTGQKHLQAANQADPGNALILTYLGRSQKQTGQTDAAMASWRSAQQADPKDPTPWLYQAQAELQDNHPLAARESLRQAQARTAYRSVYRGEHLLKEDEQLLQANLAEIQRRLGLERIAFQTLSTSVGEKNSASLRNQADVLQGQRFGESARRSLLLQSMFNDRPGNLPAELDIYGDGAGQTGAATPQHGVVGTLAAQQTSYGNYDELFSRRTTLEADAITGSQNTSGEQIRLGAVGAGSDTLGLGIAQLQFKTDGYATFEGLDNSVWQGTVQWQPVKSTQAFVSYQAFNSQHGETFYPADPTGFGSYNIIEDDSKVTRLGLRHTLTDGSEIRGVWSRQQTDQMLNGEFICNTLPGCDFFNPLPLPFPQFSYSGNSNADSSELQYRRSGAAHSTQWGAQQTHGQTTYSNSAGMITSDHTNKAQQFYAAWQQMLNSYWQLDAQLGWGQIEDQDNLGTGNNTYIQDWLPKLGVVYTPNAGTHLRLAAWKGMGVPGAGDATLAPVSLVDVLLTRPSDNGKLVQAVAFVGDSQLSTSWLLAAEARQRKTDQPSVALGEQSLVRQQVDESRLALHWQPEGAQWIASLAGDYESIQNPPESFALDSVDEQSLRSQQLALRWFASAQWTVNLAWSHNWVTGTHKTFMDPINFDYTVIYPAYQDSFNQADVDLTWQFAAYGMLSAGVRNATDASFQYADIDRLNPRFSNGRLAYARLKITW